MTTWRTRWILDRFRDAYSDQGPKIWVPTMMIDGSDGVLIVSHSPELDGDVGLPYMLWPIVMSATYVQGIAHAYTAELIESKIEADSTIVSDPEDPRRLVITESTREGLLCSRAYPLRDNPRGMPVPIDHPFTVPREEMPVMVELIEAAWAESENTEGAPVALSSMPLAYEELFDGDAFCFWLPYEEAQMRALFRKAKEQYDW